MTTFLLIRHGETDAVGKSIMGWRPGWHLNQTGQQQARRLSQRLSPVPIRAVYTSPLERAVETATIIAEPHGITPQPEEDFGEVRVGEWEGYDIPDLDTREDWRRYNVFRSGVRAPGGELMIETLTRMIRRIEALTARHPDEIVAVVSHGDPLRAAIAHYLGIALDFLLRFEIAPASLSIVQIGEWGPRTLCVNDTGEVPL